MTERRRPFPGAEYLTVDEYDRAIAGDLDLTEAVERAKRRESAHETGYELPPTEQEVDELVRGYTDEKLRDLRSTAEMGTVWRQLLDAETRRRGGDNDGT